MNAEKIDGVTEGAVLVMLLVLIIVFCSIT